MVGAATVVMLFLFMFWISRNMALPGNLWLMDFPGSELAFSFKCPPGRNFEFALTMPREKFDLEGHLTLIKDGKVVTECVLDKTTAQWCNWLRNDTNAFLLTRSLNTRKTPKGLSTCLVPGERYQILEHGKPPAISTEGQIGK